MIRKEVLLDVPRDEVWSALTDPERLEDWFANDVELDLRPGGDASFRWSNGEERHATVTEVELERRLAFEWADEGSSSSRWTMRSKARSSRSSRPRRRGRPRSSCGPARW